MSHACALLRTSRRLLPFLWLVTVLPGSILAQAPDSLSFQGYVTDPGGTPLNATVPMTFKLYKDGTKVWQQVHGAVTVTGGRFDVLLGGPGAASLDTVAFNQPIDLGITIDTDPEISPRTPLTSAAYALGLRGLYTFWARAGDYDAEAPNLVGGAPSNYVAPGVIGATIGGGGGRSLGVPRPNRVLGDWGAVGGGRDNWTDGAASTVGGGRDNSATGNWSTVAGGIDGTAAAGATVGGGSNNAAAANYAVVSGGFHNAATEAYAVVPGGYRNAARGYDAFAAGHKARANHSGTFVWNDRSVTTGNDSLVSTDENQFLIRAAGGVGIGTASPDNQLSVEGHADISGNLGIGLVSPEAQVHMTKSDGSAKGLKIESTEGDRASFYYSVDKGLVIDSYRPKDARRLDLLLQPNGGNVGIGTLTPGYLLEVDGDAAKPGGGSWTVASDQRLKDIEAPFDRGLDALQTLRPVSYRYKKDNPRKLPSDQTYIGLIAQEVESVIPEAVSRDDAGYLHLNNDPIIWTMLNAINALREENERQQAQIEQLISALKEVGAGDLRGP